MARSAGFIEVWAARAWNVFNEGRPFTLVYPVLVLCVAALVGLAPDGSLGLALLGSLALAVVLSRFPFPLRGRALLWLALAVSVPLLEPWRAPALVLGALAGWAFFTVFFWGTLYYRLRTHAPWTNFLRFWRLVLTNSDPTSGNALEQVPKIVMTISAGALLAEEPGAGSAVRIAAVALIAAALGTVAWRRFARRLPQYPAQEPGTDPFLAPRAKRVYVIVVDGCNRERLWQANTPTIDRLAREGTEYLNVEPAYPARTVVCFSSMLTGAAPPEHGMHSNFAPRLGVRCESVFDVLERHGRRGRLVGIAHLLDPFGEDIVRAVTSVQPTERIDHSLVAAAREVVERDDPDLLVLQLLAADQLGHVRGVRNREYLDQLEETDRHVADFLAWLGERGKLDDATVILMADHGQGRGIGGHGHLDWGETPVPFIVHGAGAAPGTVSHEPHNVCELAATVSALLGVEPPAAARGRALVKEKGPSPGLAGRCLAVVPTLDEERVIGDVVARIPDTACGMRVDTLVIDDGSQDGTAAIARAAGAEVISNPRPTGLGAAVRQGLAEARDRGYDAAVYLDGDGEYDPADFERVLDPVARGRAEYVIGSRFLGHREGMTWHRTLANRLTSALLGTLMDTVVSDGQTGYRAFGRRALAEARIRHDYNYAQVLTLSLWGAGIDPVEVPISYRRRETGHSFVSYPEYFARVAPALWREFRHARRQRATKPAPIAPATTYGVVLSSKNGNTASSGPHGASGRPTTSPPPPQRTST
ncbi:MAG: alkaline phosphatase family protein [Solirubrobacteraceae bacterium]